MKRFENRTVIVTGGARGMGASHACGFIAEGANVVIADVVDQEGQSLVDELGGRAIFSRLDVTSEADWAATVTAAENAFARYPCWSKTRASCTLHGSRTPRRRTGVE